MKRLGIPDLFVEHGSQPLLRAKYGIDENGILEAVKEMVGEEKSSSIHPNRNKASVRRAIPNPK